MMPSAFVILEAMPLTPNGKVDRKALPSPDSSNLSLKASFVAPRTPTEEVLAAIWSNVLDLKQVGIHDNFFELGGHSLLATKLLFKISTVFYCELPLQILWERPTIEELAVFINDPHKNVQKYHMYIEIGSRYTNLPLSFNQQRRWFFGQAKTTRDFPTNIYSAIRLIGKLNVRIIEQVFNEIVCRHEVLRTNFISSGGNSIQVVRSQSMLSVPIEDIKGLDKQDSEKNARKCAIQEFKRPFDLTKDTPIRLKLLKIDDQEYIILLIVEHIVFDGWSMNIFLNEFSLLYNSFIMDQPSPLPEQSIQYSDFVLWQQKQLTGRYFENLLWL
jgi:hypothetical protein